MKNQLPILLAFIFLFSCKEQHLGRTPFQVQSKTYNLYGDAFETDSILSLDELSQKIEKIGDTLTVNT